MLDASNSSGVAAVHREAIAPSEGWSTVGLRLSTLVVFLGGVGGKLRVNSIGAWLRVETNSVGRNAVLARARSFSTVCSPVSFSCRADGHGLYRRRRRVSGSTSIDAAIRSKDLRVTLRSPRSSPPT